MVSEDTVLDNQLTKPGNKVDPPADPEEIFSEELSRKSSTHKDQELENPPEPAQPEFKAQITDFSIKREITVTTPREDPSEKEVSVEQRVDFYSEKSSENGSDNIPDIRPIDATSELDPDDEIQKLNTFKDDLDQNS